MYYSKLNNAANEILSLADYCEIQFRQIALYWALGILIGSAVSVFAKDKIHSVMARLQDESLGAAGLIPACLLGIASPLCMYGTIPIAASFS